MVSARAIWYESWKNPFRASSAAAACCSKTVDFLFLLSHLSLCRCEAIRHTGTFILANLSADLLRMFCSWVMFIDIFCCVVNSTSVNFCDISYAITGWACHCCFLAVFPHKKNSLKWMDACVLFVWSGTQHGRRHYRRWNSFMSQKASINLQAQLRILWIWLIEESNQVDPHRDTTNAV